MKKSILLSCISAFSLLTITGCCKEETVYVDKPTPTDFVNQKPVLHIEMEPPTATIMNPADYVRTYTDGRVDSISQYNTYLVYGTEIDQTTSLGYQKPTDYTYTIETDYPIMMSNYKSTQVPTGSIGITCLESSNARGENIPIIQPNQPVSISGENLTYLSFGWVGGYNYFQQYWRSQQAINVKITVTDKYQASTTRILKLSFKR